MNQIVNIINREDQSGQNYSAQEVEQILKMVLSQDHSHKQWLAVTLTEEVLLRCGEKMSICEQGLLDEIEKVAQNPSSKGGWFMQSKAKDAAMMVLQAFESNAGRQSYMSSTEDHYQQRQFGAQNEKDLLHNVRSLILEATSRSELLQEMILAMTSGKDEQLETQLGTSITSEIQELKQEFPAAINALSGLQNSEAEMLTAALLETADQLDNVRSMYESALISRQQESSSNRSTHNKTFNGDNLTQNNEKIEDGSIIDSNVDKTPQIINDNGGQINTNETTN
eukprot:TRINITY_DN512_c0_g3_i7.p1 TRINITY_DN512_c0_g3~~TRINITY_DN512_c0_g3_i7.p1  ORF type:complete len:282 (+),score=40.50 TRINITY_DN512_c0_g3_i7:115-960(+)